MAAFANQARSIRPQLQFFFAGELPIYATSQCYGGSTNSTADLDLEGVFFTDIPWVLANTTPQQALRQTLASQQPTTFNQLKRLYALGVDAYQLIAQLDRMRGSADENFQGETGSLRLDETGRIHRQLLWAHFEHGIAVLPGASASVTP